MTASASTAPPDVSQAPAPASEAEGDVAAAGGEGQVATDAAPAAVESAEDAAARLEAVLERAREVGRVDLGELRRVLTEAEVSTGDGSRMVRELSDAGVTLVVGESTETEAAEEAVDVFAVSDLAAGAQPGVSSDLVKEYLREIGRVALLDAAQEVELSKRIEAGLFAERKLGRVAAEGTALSDEDRFDLEWLTDDGRRAKNHLLEANLRLVVSVAKKYTGRGMGFLDLIQEGNLGLVRAVEKFDYTKGYKFSTYAMWWIRQAITRAMADQARTIRLPVHLVEQVNKMSRIQRQLLQTLGREPTAEELARELDTTPERIVEMQRQARDPMSLDAVVGEDGDTRLGDLVEDSEAPVASEAVAFTLLQEQLSSVLDSLPERESKVVALRFGPHRRPAQDAGRGGQALRAHPRAHPADREAHAGEAAAPVAQPGPARLPGVGPGHRRHVSDSPRQNVEYASNGGTAHGYLATPPGGRGPGVVVIQEWWGLTDHVVSVADRFAAEGFVALAPDLYGGTTTHDADEAGRLMSELPVDTAARDLGGAVDLLLSSEAVTSATVGAVGFCMGGGFVLLLAAQQGDRVGLAVPFYGVGPGVAQADLSTITAPVLGHFGTQDEMATPEVVDDLERQLRASGSPSVVLHRYEAGHAFFNDEDHLGTYDPDLAAQAWQRTVEGLRSALR